MKKLIMFVLITLSIKSYSMVPVVDVEAVSQLTVTVEQLRLEVAMMQQNLQMSGTYSWPSINAAAKKVAMAMKAASKLSYLAANIDEQFKQTYPGYSPNANFSQQYQDLSRQSLDSIQDSLSAMNVSYAEFQSEELRLQAMQISAKTANGALKALQANAQLISEVASQVAGLRSIMIAQSNSQQLYMAHQVQVEATRKANGGAMINNGTTTSPIYGTYKMNTSF